MDTLDERILHILYGSDSPLTLVETFSSLRDSYEEYADITEDDVWERLNGTLSQEGVIQSTSPIGIVYAARGGK